MRFRFRKGFIDNSKKPDRGYYNHTRRNRRQYNKVSKWCRLLFINWFTEEGYGTLEEAEAFSCWRKIKRNGRR